MNWVVIALALAMAVGATAQTKEKEPQNSAAAVRTLTGCIDQRAEDFVLTGDVALRAVARLKGEGFSEDNFAQHLGKKVRVEGRMTRENEMPVFYVRSLTALSDACTPAPPPQ